MLTVRNFKGGRHSPLSHPRSLFPPPPTSRQTQETPQQRLGEAAYLRLQEAYLAEDSVSSPPLRGFVEAVSEAFQNHVHDVAFLTRGRLLSANL